MNVKETEHIDALTLVKVRTTGAQRRSVRAILLPNFNRVQSNAALLLVRSKTQIM
jgi:hypothetical protein